MIRARLMKVRATRWKGTALAGPWERNRKRPSVPALLRGCSSVLLMLCLVGACLHAQEQGAASSRATSEQSANSASQGQSPEAQRGKTERPGEEPGEASNEAANKNDAKLAMELRAAHSPIVSWIARVTGIRPEVAYWIFIVLDFAILILFFWILLKSKLPQAFRERTATIQRGIREAQAASAEASRRLSKIEARLAQLDAEVAEIRTSAENDAAAEEARIRQAAEEDKRKVVEGAETEIAAFARNARRELKSYAASLAVDLASRRIRVDESTDHALVHEFVDQLGKDGK
jgi:F-type H+-transporting ATPase subunit b